MRAMILAAGLGTRLRPLTEDRPKALVTIDGRTLLEIALLRLKCFGVHDVIVNVHHYAEMVIEYLKAQDHFGMHIEISREELLLDTGGGLQKAANFFLKLGGESDEPFILHNVDVISSIDLRRMVRAHVERSALATLAVQNRKSSRYLLFDESGLLCGRRDVRSGSDELVRDSDELHERAFCGIHMISPKIFARMKEGKYSIIATYLDVAGQSEKITAFNADGSYWRDLGTPESLALAAKEIDEGKYTIV